MDAQLYFARHHQLQGFGEAKQTMLRQAKVLVIGAGGLGCPVLEYLSAAGIGRLTVVDGDVVSASNLHRQVVYRETDIGRKKVALIKERLSNTFCQIDTLDQWLDEPLANELFPQFDVIVDTCDNFATRYLVSDVCEKYAKCLVSAGISRFAGQLCVYNYLMADGARSGSYRCLFPSVDEEAPTCSNDGVLSTAVGIMGLLQANEVIKVITRDEHVLANRLLLYNALTNEQKIIKFRRATTFSEHKLTTDENKALTELKGLRWEELKSWKETGIAFELIDVREAWEHEERNEGGVNIPLGEIVKSSAQFPKDRPLVFYCKRSERSRIAIQRLQDKGLANAMYYVVQ